MWNNKTGQNWTIDLLVGVVIFLSVAIFFYTILQSNLSEETSFDQTSDELVEKLNAQNYPDDYNGTPVPIEGYSVKEDEMAELYNKNYDQVKEELGIRGDFCMIVVDDQGSLVAFNQSGTEQYSFGRGDGDVVVGDGIRCGE